ncbi:MAG: lycopene cyclase family protein [Bacteroidetes bacterium]|nr:lycopene cyclase family protein [Bacteroidota bacterium]
MKYDYAIIGAGAAGILLAHELLSRPSLASKRLLIIDRIGEDHRNRTWCFWAEPGHALDFLVRHRYSHIAVSDTSEPVFRAIHPFTYNRIEGADFHDHFRPLLQQHKRVNWVTDTVTSLETHADRVELTTEKGDTYQAALAFDSRFSYSRLKDSRYPVLQQHFVGFEIETEQPFFEPSHAHFMDFSVAQIGNTRFMYVLPTAPNRTLVEYTLFSHKQLPYSEYQNAIEEYVKKQGINQFRILSEEKGSIPMSAHPLWKPLSSRVLPIGLNGGWAKASTGFAFNRTLSRAATLADQLSKKPNSLPKLHFKDRFWLYDLLLLDIIDRDNSKGAALFTRLFQKRNPKLILTFLDEKTHFLQELSIMAANRPLPFIKAFFRWAVKGF